MVEYIQKPLMIYKTITVSKQTIEKYMHLQQNKELDGTMIFIDNQRLRIKFIRKKKGMWVCKVTNPFHNIKLICASRNDVTKCVYSAIQNYNWCYNPII